MPYFGDTSRKHLDTCRPEIVETLRLVVAEYDIKVLEGRRSWDRQADLLEEGRTTKGPGESKHNPPKLPDGTEDKEWLSNAVDVAPYPIDWTDTKRFIYMAGLIIGTGRALGYNFRWGGNWDEDQIIIDDQNFNDLPHIEYVGRFEDG
jgi:peptidoglycan L-alanyl-D-glutamate endopeptidase CwlK